MATVARGLKAVHTHRFSPLPLSTYTYRSLVLFEVFKGKGTNANSFLDGVSVNGIGNATGLEVFQDPATGHQ